MRLHIVARGKIGRSPEADLVARYLKRVSWPTQLTELPDTGGRIPALPANSRTVVLDEKGKPLGSIEFAEMLSEWRDSGVRETRFLIGAADGFDDKVRKDADFVFGFGKATWPHMMVRAMLAEQLWRATAIIAGHPYHREG